MNVFFSRIKSAEVESSGVGNMCFRLLGGLKWKLRPGTSQPTHNEVAGRKCNFLANWLLLECSCRLVSGRRRLAVVCFYSKNYGAVCPYHSEESYKDFKYIFRRRERLSSFYDKNESYVRSINNINIIKLKILYLTLKFRDNF